MSARDVIGLGFATLDTIGLVPHLPDLDAGVLLEDLTRQGGGPVAQALVTLARLGASVGFVGRIGDDEVGAEIRSGLTGEGVDISFLQIEPGARSPQSMILVDKPTGKRSICAFRGTADDIEVADDTLDYLCCGRFLHLDGHSPAAALAAAEAAAERGVRTCLDAGAGASIDHLLPLVRATTVLIAAEQFAMSVSPDGMHKTGEARLLEMGPEIVVVTRGEQGSTTLTADTAFSTAAFPVSVVDTTGAGDVFHGAYLYGLLQGWDLMSTAEFAGATAALKCTRLGGRAAIPRLPEVLDFLAEHGRQWVRT
ncbi:MAG: sugar kinase [Chloroflexia bacterium]|nr:sugar kinase [Chloroflexia bacterium]